MIVAAGTTFNEYNDFYNYTTIQNYGTIHCYGLIYSNGTIVNHSDASVVVESGGTMQSYGEFDNFGTVETAGGFYADGIYNTTGTTTIDAGGSMAIWTDISLSGVIADNGSLVIWSGGQDMNCGGAVVGSGTILLACGSDTVTFGGDNSGFTGTLLNEGGTLDASGMNPNSTVSVDWATLIGSGTVGNITIQAGTLAPGDSLGGILTASGLTLSSYANYLVAINGATAGTGYTQTIVNGQVDLGSATLVLAGSARETAAARSCSSRARAA